MEANVPENNKRKAPDKIYASFGVFGVIEATEIRLTSNDIEYIRKDAFIEKAWAWIEDNILSSNQQDKALLYYEQFKKYLKK